MVADAFWKSLGLEPPAPAVPRGLDPCAVRVSPAGTAVECWSDGKRTAFLYADGTVHVHGPRRRDQ